MNTPSSTIVQRVWNYCKVLRDDGNSRGNCIAQWAPVAREVEIAVEAVLVRAGKLRQAALKSAFEGKKL